MVLFEIYRLFSLPDNLMCDYALYSQFIRTAAGLAASEAWQGCHKYYMRSVARSMALDLALASPHKVSVETIWFICDFVNR